MKISRYERYRQLREYAVKNHLLLYRGNLVLVDDAVYNNYISNKDKDDVIR